MANAEPEPRRGWRQRLAAALTAPVDAAGLAYFRVVFYGVMAWEAWRLIANQWVERYFTGKELYFKFWPFTFVEALSEQGTRWLITAMGIAAVLALLGLFYRLSATALFVLLGYVFLIEQARYLNHVYLVVLISFLMIFVPAHRCCSLDAWLRRGMRASEVPAWTIWLLRFQVGVPYFFGGVAKLNSDWLRGEPLREWLRERTDFPVIGPYFVHEPVVWVMTYGSLLLDLLAPFLLLHRRTRVATFVVVLVFHFMNARLFNIGIFPWTMIAATVIFFEPGWPRRVARDLRQGHPLRAPALAFGTVAGAVTGAFLPGDFSWMRVAIGALGAGVAAYHLDEPFRAATTPSPPAAPPTAAAPRGLLPLLGLWVAVQVLVPFRHLLIPGNVHWTEEGHNFSWHMKLRDKSTRGFFVVTDPASGRSWRVDPGEHLSPFQLRKMRSRPDLMVQFARHLEDLARREGYTDVEVRAVIHAALNDRPMQPLVDPRVDLTAVPYPWFGHAPWILPLAEREAEKTRE